MINKIIAILLILTLVGTTVYAAEISVNTILEMLDEEELVNAVEVASGLLEQYGYIVTIEKKNDGIDLSEQNIDEELSEPVKSEKFLNDFVKGWESRTERLDRDESRSSTFSDKQYIDYMTEAVSCEYSYIGKYRNAIFEEDDLSNYYHEYISALDDQFVAITEYYGKDDAAYNELWKDAYYKRCRAMYWINRKWGFNFKKQYLDTVSEMLSVGQVWDMRVSMENDLRSQLSKAEYSFENTSSKSINIAPMTIQNNTNYQIEYLSVMAEFLNDEGTTVDTAYLISESNIASGAKLETRTTRINQHFASVVFKCDYTYSNGTYRDENKMSITPAVQYSWDGILSKNGSVAEGQAIFTLEGVNTSWGREHSWTKDMYVPIIKFSIKNIGTVNANEVTIHTVFTNMDTKEIWDEETSYVIGFSDSPLKPGFSKKVFIYSSVGFETKPAIFPNLTAEIYVNNQLLKTINIEMDS